MYFRPRHRRWIALIALFGLLFQQVAMAVYTCPIEFSQPMMAASAAMPDCEQAAMNDKARCLNHCHPQQASADHAAPLTVPAAILPSTTWERAAAWQPRIAGANLAYEITARATAPPLTIQHCTFQI